MMYRIQREHSHPRRVMYFPNNGTALVERLPPRFAASVANRDTHYLDRLVREPVLRSEFANRETHYLNRLVRKPVS
jgi:hypothetical protein